MIFAKKGMVQSWVAASSAGLRLSSAECPWGWQSSTIPKSSGTGFQPVKTRPGWPCHEVATCYGATNRLL